MTGVLILVFAFALLLATLAGMERRLLGRVIKRVDPEECNRHCTPETLYPARIGLDLSTSFGMIDVTMRK